MPPNPSIPGTSFLPSCYAPCPSLWTNVQQQGEGQKKREGSYYTEQQPLPLYRCSGGKGHVKAGIDRSQFVDFFLRQSIFVSISAFQNYLHGLKMAFGRVTLILGMSKGRPQERASTVPAERVCARARVENVEAAGVSGL